MKDFIKIYMMQTGSLIFHFISLSMLSCLASNLEMNKSNQDSNTIFTIYLYETLINYVVQ